MPDFSGSCSQQLRSDTIVPVPDRTDQIISVIVRIRQAHIVGDPNRDEVPVTNWGSALLVGPGQLINWLTS
jgi:hypothetical protein